ncbi:MAG TPA: universal stress protein [Thermoplasmata archaeon]|nr:universal stress protein [Thermoplasmata archaeon]
MPAVGFERIAVAIDGSTYADRALEVASDLAKRYGAKVTVLTVAPLTAYAVSAEPWVPTEVLEGEVRHYKEVLAAAVAKAEGTGLSTVTGVCLEGHIAEELVAFLEKNPADLLVMGSRGLSATRRLLLGSTSDEVLHHVTCPVLIVRPPAATPPAPPADPRP